MTCPKATLKRPQTSHRDNAAHVWQRNRRRRDIVRWGVMRRAGRAAYAKGDFMDAFHLLDDARQLMHELLGQPSVAIDERWTWQTYLYR